MNEAGDSVDGQLKDVNDRDRVEIFRTVEKWNEDRGLEAIQRKTKGAHRARPRFLRWKRRVENYSSFFTVSLIVPATSRCSLIGT
jgi:hypothetical protein